jgi:plasmid stabilization system protein ParE
VADLDQIVARIGTDNPDAARRLREAVMEKLQLIASFPQAGSTRLSLGPEVRILVLGNCLIGYRPRRDRIRALRIWHGARKLGLLPLD